jgi:hypothetical protein
MPFNLNFLANVIFLIISIYNIIYLFLVIGFIKEFKRLIDFIIAR